MKKFGIFLVFVCIASFAFSQEAVTLRAAINSAAAKIEQEIGNGKKVAIYDFISTSHQLSDYVIDELIDIFTNHKKLAVAERKRLAIVRNERDYQWGSGEVDDNEILSMTHGMGIDFVITGQLDYDGLYWRFRVYAIDSVKRARVASSSLHIRNNDKQIAYYLGGATPNGGAPSKPATGGGNNGDYTTGERIGTAALNTFFGVGSLLQGDGLGFITLLGEGAGIGLLTAGLLVDTRMEVDSQGHTSEWDRERYYKSIKMQTTFMIAGGVTIGVSVLFGYIIPFFHHKPNTAVAAGDSPFPLRLDLVSTDNQGINGLKVSYNMRF